MRAFRSILLVVATVALSVALIAYPVSFYRSVALRRLAPRWVVASEVNAGRVGLFWQTYPVPVGHVSWHASVSPVRTRFFRANQRWRETVRFEFSTQAYRASNGGSIVARSVRVPLWCPILLLAVGPTLALQRRLTRRRRRRAGACPQCGYDLRQSPERCPECGAAANR